MLTDDQIDQLSGRELDRAVSNAAGYYCGPGNSMVYIEGHGVSDLPFYHRDLGAAMSLLLECGHNIQIRTHHPRTASDDKRCIIYVNYKERLLASGPKSEAAAICCRAYLKLKNREGKRRASFRICL